MSNQDPAHQLDRAAELIVKAKRLVVFTGAGMSADSGIATFRTGSGLWTGLVGKIGLFYFGTPIGWKLTPGWAWSSYVTEFYRPIAMAEPNPGHTAISSLFTYLKKRNCSTRIITMNVDGLHQRAGHADAEVFEIHGTVRRHCCCHHKHPMEVEISLEGPVLPPPNCATCGSTPRPECVLFMESLPMRDWGQSALAIDHLTQEDVLLVIGTSGVVYPAAGLPLEALDKGVNVIEINMIPSPISSRALFLQGRSAEITTSLVERVIQLGELQPE